LRIAVTAAVELEGHLFPKVNVMGFDFDFTAVG